jgi:peroxiredoxin
MKVGDRAPEFSLYSDSKERFTLSEAIKNGPVLMLFFPAAFTGTCTTELNEVNNDFEAYHGATVVGISTDSPFTLAEYSKVNGLTFPLLSDHDAEVCTAYGTRHTEGFGPMGFTRIARRSAFVVDRDGIIRYAELTPNPGVIPDLSAIQAILRDL